MKQRIITAEKSGQFDLPLTDDQITNLVVKECKERDIRERISDTHDRKNGNGGRVYV